MRQGITFNSIKDYPADEFVNILEQVKNNLSIPSRIIKIPEEVEKLQG